MKNFKALRIVKDGDKQRAEFATLTMDDLMPGDVTVQVKHSSVNYKDGLAVTGKAPIIRQFPLIPGIDLAGTVIDSQHPRWKAGDHVVMGGWGMGENHHGGYAEVARLKGDWLVAQPKGLTLAQTMAIGVAGYTAMLCVIALEEQGITPNKGEIIVTGAAGGVGSVSLVLLSKLGFSAVASTGRMEEEAFLKNLGATAVINRAEFNSTPKPLAKMRWAGGIDSVGSVTLANILSQTKEEGAIAACGLAQGMDLPTSVAPFILRGVRLIGVNSVNTPIPRREMAWERLAQDLDQTKLASLTTHVKLDDVPRIAEDIVAGKVRGRVVVDL
jgi:acrylyl-CoA reductase (NADPH)